MDKTYTIKAVSKEINVSESLLRAWERRYGLISPIRSATGRRLYSQDDVFHLSLLKKAVDKGHAIGAIANLENRDLEKLIYGRQESGSDTNKEDMSYLYTRCISEIKELRQEHFEKTLLQASVEFSLNQVLDQLILPLLAEIGNQWRDGTLRIHHEHMATQTIRNFINNLRRAHSSYTTTSPTVISTTLSGQAHDLGVLCAGLTLISGGWRVIHLGANLPFYEIAASFRQADADAIILGITYPNQDATAEADLRQLRQMVPDAPIVVGGRAIESYDNVLSSIHAIKFEDLNNLRAWQLSNPITKKPEAL